MGKKDIQTFMKIALKDLRDSFNVDYSILILADKKEAKVFTSISEKKEYAEIYEILKTCAKQAKEELK